MGFKSSEWAYGDSVPKLTAPERAVLVALAHCRNDKTGNCYPGQDLLVKMTDLSEKTVRRAIATLEARQPPLIARTIRFNGRYRTSDSYELLFDNYRSERPPVTVTTGQDDHWSESPSPPVTVSPTTGHSDHPIEEQEVEQEAGNRKVSLSPLTPDLDAEFDRAWAHWPKKEDRKRSLLKFKSAARRRDVSILVADIIRFGDAYASARDRQYTPGLATWLERERWTDELPTRPMTRTEQNMAVVADLAAREAEEQQRGLTA
ncbi:helix-turn-helix domain-containing protein [Microbacterium sp. LWH3-1.2]|uniref:helix-turn-helix domain-containing protein n=1 Tax=Microbacterium sp. LWH3-1.2 TaxID=3135256 RepID=UPI0034449D3A